MMMILALWCAGSLAVGLVWALVGSVLGSQASWRASAISPRAGAVPFVQAFDVRHMAGTRGG